MTRKTLKARSPHRLRTAIRAADLDGARLADAAGVSRAFVSLILNGRRRCDPTIAAAIAQELNAPVEHLFTSDMLSEDSYNETEEDVLTVTDVDEDPILGFDQVAQLCNIPPGTLRHLRVIGDGPPFHKRGHILRIRKSDAQKWYRQRFESDIAESASAD
ncbi:helix-turn-helix domain-containing protein [Nonomuraea sp. bgisy101]|uniref:helix-turn-helix domain-containing protein n=1 Tax=Nonomuraea sp. bgisy101 TaxID=3413784 RepID=UPI003D71E444